MELEVDTKSQSMDINAQMKMFRWRIENFSSITHKKLYSESFIADGNKWRILVFSKGNNTDHLSVYLDVADSATLPSGWSRFAQFGIVVIDQFDRKKSVVKVTVHEFNANDVDWGFTSILPLTELHNPSRGYLVNDACVVEVYVSSDIAIDLISLKKVAETGSVDITTPPQPSCPVLAIESKDPTETDMNMFFSSLESEFLRSNIVFSREQAREALVKLDEALTASAFNFYHPGKFSPLRQAFKIHASFDCSSTSLTTDEKNKLLASENRLKALACRATKVVQYKNLIASKESIKMNVTCNLECSLIRLKKLEEKLGALHEQVEEAQKKREGMLAEQKEIFENSKKMKMELETLGKECAGYESNAKVVEQEEKIIEAEWKRLRDFISSIKGKI